MTRIILLDAGPLSLIAHPRNNPEIKAWLQTLLNAGVKIAIPEIADYEVRRELLRAQRTTSVQRLDALGVFLLYLPITTSVMRHAATFWADLRRQGQPTATDAALDADVILGAQAAELMAQGHDVVIATTNVQHLARMAPAQRWQDIT